MQNNMQMSDKDSVNGILGDYKLEKEALSHAVVEATYTPLRNDFHNVLDTCFQDQKKVFDLMNQKGWYQIKQASQQDITNLKNKVTQQASV